MAPFKDPGPITFTADLQGDPPGTYVLFPADVPSLFGVSGRVPIRVQFRASAAGPMQAYTGSMLVMGTPQHCILVVKAIREELGLAVGKPVHVTVCLDSSERKVEIPAALRAALAAVAVPGPHAGGDGTGGTAGSTALDLFTQQSFTCQKEYVQWIEEAKKEETRASRISQTVELVLAKHSAGPRAAGSGNTMKGPREDAAALRAGGTKTTASKAESAGSTAGTGKRGRGDGGGVEQAGKSKRGKK